MGPIEVLRRQTSQIRDAWAWDRSKGPNREPQVKSSKGLDECEMDIWK